MAKMNIRIVHNEIEFQGYLVAHITHGWATLQDNFTNAVQSCVSAEDYEELQERCDDLMDELEGMQGEVSGLKDEIDYLRDQLKHALENQDE
jgi:predicted  nucleic acid-binding Zn-ribbon protein